jgi:hypothetical protein
MDPMDNNELDAAIMEALEPILRSIGATFVAVTIQNKDNFAHGVTGTTPLVKDDVPFEATKKIFIELLENHIKMLKKPYN